MLEAPEIEHYCLTIQKDIAARLTAKKGDKNFYPLFICSTLNAII